MQVSSSTIKRILILSIFLLGDIWLGVQWIRLQRNEVVSPIKNFLEEVHPMLPQIVLGDALDRAVPLSAEEIKPFTSEEIAQAVNRARAERKIHELEVSTLLSQGAQKIVDAVVANNLSFEGIDSSKLLTTFLQQKKAENLSLYHDTLIGPRTLVQLQKYWDNDPDHLQSMAAPELTTVGVATGSAKNGDQEAGVVVIIYGKPQSTVQQATAITTKNTKTNMRFPEISDSSVLEALNAYRASHTIHALVEHPKLCEYAAKRVQDLVAFGGLDNHEGFKKDFADQNNLPAAIREYPGGAIGENLAYQDCRNMKTGEAFVAQTATALIEWCFDSSTKGHREAQLNPKYNNVCARHQDGYFVIIFGE